MSQIRRVAILGGNRIPFARSGGAYLGVSNQEMLGAAIQGLVDRYKLKGERIGEVAGGAVMKHSRDFNLVRETVLDTTLDPHTPAYDVQQACGTGLEAAILVSNKIALGQIDSAIAGGVDSTSDAPVGLNDSLRRKLMVINAQKTNQDKAKKALGLLSADWFKPDIPRNGEPRTGLAMGDHAAITAKEWGITRQAQDELALASHHNLAKSYADGWQKDLISPFKGLEKDNNMRGDSKMEKLATLKPCFGGPDGTMTAANSTPLTDGASAVLLASEEWAAKKGLKPLAYFRDGEAAAVDFTGKNGSKEGLLMAPAYAVARMLARNNLSLQDFDYYEIHEAFASQVLATLAAWESEKFCKEKLGLSKALGSIDRAKLNVKGSSLAAGHPFAATGGRILANAAKLLDAKGSGRVLISICAAGGQGVVAIVEK
ncbi:MAG: acetyl-CoA C-acetyltransferase [Gammaproteobacteria bacterium]